MPPSIDNLALLTAIAQHQPRRMRRRNMVKRAAVAVVMHEQPNGTLELLFMQRAVRVGDPWSGDMSFPGGRRDAGDTTLQHTAIRELREETGLNLLGNGRYVGRLSDVVTRQHRYPLPMVVTPHVFLLDEQVPLTGDARETASLHWLPLAELANPDNKSKLIWRRRGMRISMPSIEYDGCTIWGLTHLMLQELLWLAGQGRRARRLPFIL